jgi:AcrR family transcriptional regulator
MPQRMKAEERREQILALMADIHRQAETQGDFTAEAVAKAAGISTVLLYRYVGSEFQALRAQLPGVHRIRDEVMSELRQEIAVLHHQLQEAQGKLRATALSELDEAIRMIELLEEENLHLRGEVKRLRKQLEERTRVVVHVPATHSQTPQLALVKQDESRTTENE